MDWKKYAAYRVFDEFVETFFINRKSFITTHAFDLDFEAGLKEINACYLQNFDDSRGKDFDQKIEQQFGTASDNAKIIMTNLEYLWGMPTISLGAATKLRHASRWFPGQVRSGPKYFFEDSKDCIAHAGVWHGRNKFGEIGSLVYLLKAFAGMAPESLEQSIILIREFSYQWVYQPDVLKKRYGIITEVFRKSAMQNLLLHFSNPDQFEVIASGGHKDEIVSRFASELGVNSGDREQKIKAIKTALYDRFPRVPYADEDSKCRWFFYTDKVKAQWHKSTSKNHTKNAIRRDNEALAAEAMDGVSGGHTGTEGETGYTTIKVRTRDPKLVANVKRRDMYTCRSCGFWYENRIVHVHHLDPLSEQEGVVETKSEALITLCPNCHSLAHDLLRDGEKYKDQATLLSKLSALNEAQQGEI